MPFLFGPAKLEQQCDAGKAAPSGTNPLTIRGVLGQKRRAVMHASGSRARCAFLPCIFGCSQACAAPSPARRRFAPARSACVPSLFSFCATALAILSVRRSPRGALSQLQTPARLLPASLLAAAGIMPLQIVDLKQHSASIVFVRFHGSPAGRFDLKTAPLVSDPIRIANFHCGHEAQISELLRLQASCSIPRAFVAVRQLAV